MPTIDEWQEFAVRAGTILRAEPSDGARHPAFRLWIDFGELGILQSSARITDRYRAEDLVGTQVVAVTGFAPLRVGGFRSDVLVLGAPSPEGVVLLRPELPVAPGSEIA